MSDLVPGPSFQHLLIEQSPCVETIQNSEDTDPILSFTDMAKTKDMNPAEVGDAVHTTLNKLDYFTTQDVLGSVLVSRDGGSMPVSDRYRAAVLGCVCSGQPPHFFFLFYH